METIAPVGPVYQAGTFSGNPISVVAGLATLNYIKSKGKAFYERLESKTNTIVNAFRDCEENNPPFQINHIASMFQIFFTPNFVYDYRSAKTADVARFKTYHTKLLENEVYIPPSQFETCFVSESLTREDVHKTNEAIAHSLSSPRTV
jgi:glutamate-1-semialdehyde 2,1-aminomutase